MCMQYYGSYVGFIHSEPIIIHLKYEISTQNHETFKDVEVEGLVQTDSQFVCLFCWSVQPWLDFLNVQMLIASPVSTRVIFGLVTNPNSCTMKGGNPSNLPYVHLLRVWSPQKWVPFNDPWRIPVLFHEIYLGDGQKGKPYHTVAAQLWFPILPTTPNVTPPETRG